MRVLLLNLTDQSQEPLAQSLRLAGMTPIANGEGLSGHPTPEEADLLLITLREWNAESASILPSLKQSHRLPLLLALPAMSPALVEQMVECGADGLLTLPLFPDTVAWGAAEAVARHARHIRLEQRLLQTEQKLQSRKLVERAKGMLMQTRQCSEEEAYRAMRKLAMNHQQTMEAVAQRIIEAARLLS